MLWPSPQSTAPKLSPPDLYLEASVGTGYPTSHVIIALERVAEQVDLAEEFCRRGWNVLLAWDMKQIDENVRRLRVRILVTDDYQILKLARFRNRPERLFIAMVAEHRLDETLQNALRLGADWATGKPCDAVEFFGEEPAP